MFIYQSKPFCYRVSMFSNLKKHAVRACDVVELMGEIGRLKSWTHSLRRFTKETAHLDGLIF